MENNNKQKVIKTLTTVIDSLERDYVVYDWNEQCSCNCGLVVQSALDVSKNKLEKIRTPLFKGSRTWKDAIKNSCSVTGKTDIQLIKDLESMGFHRSDFTHLEYLDNPVILKLSGIRKPNILIRPFVSKYYTRKRNLILYLKAWVSILKDEIDEVKREKLTDKNKLQAKLVNAVAEENYEEAAELRDKLAV